ncbi:MAG: hypothetical protein A2268_14255 [Candidatus Raymondbacteria bacterium RifOxyA12_full_50_37]|uniref:CR-type domain-containing protein n=1 Tax=Candidatus Raymondbacteria bacterium RIFOXYD12_FULL_49_13 TaxID=1817890 RepID=A0A1F7FLE9_UNCRA|nr:MAG: hypothetical protein A2268_14255 [Candidatus Raymondbacteria bacterium RifOxyA12_full_50_37]OGJ86922.1 MAG: hypothetical protein A2350_02165 [Candidatus Raymondbacteria bacterium RifOxyB12_full_50_8]OGJ88242.1 MAG: hypothetical protein A2248_19595 [Candidatus Raymondbacteria bacterium RIFOXYA2_FULL_49_16]OGJ97109.1 MAG: hypothetical protein A2487_05905 [Candidatus Raymondbacteria bacterium RifOxyC12_full_50_8]OGK07287.1 MAG: hypothetical protein A2519_14265 [Candidatus Raymondbacteria b
MLKNRSIIFITLCACMAMLPACVKKQDPSPRYDADACLLCSHWGHAEDAGKCFICKGTAVCTFCDGKGKRLLGTKDAWYEAPCQFCNGTGKCHYCEGTGKCFLCKGTGKYIPLKPEPKGGQ